MTEKIDVLIIGAGVIGLAIAREFAMQGREVIVVEEENSIGTGTSSRNSEVVHAGIYYEPRSLKAQLCVEGKKLLYDYCSTHGVDTRKIGKLIIAQSDTELPKLAAIEQTAILNGVFDLIELSAVEAMRLEPELRCKAALLSPSTGIIDGAAFMLSLQGEAEQYGAVLAFDSKVVSGNSYESNIEAEIKDAKGNVTRLLCNTVINCAGHGAHEAAMALTGLSSSYFPPRYLAKGSYCNVSGKLPFSHLIYPLPVPGALGIHVTLDMQGAAKLGPSIEWVDREDHTVSEHIIPEFRKAFEGFCPKIRDRRISAAYCGIRPKISGPNTNAADFFIETGKSIGAPTLINLLGIESPGLTSSLAIARHVSQIAKGAF